MIAGSPGFDWCEARWSVLPGGAVLRREDGMLVVADLHLGKDRSFRAAGLPVPAGSSGRTLERLAAMLSLVQPNRLLILGDLLHDRWSMTPALSESFADLHRAHAHTEILLLRGNHDRHAGDPPPHCGVRCVEPPYTNGGVTFFHEPPTDDRSEPWAAGHVHPVVRMQGRLGAAMRLPALIAGSRRMLLPAFGDFTGGFVVRPASDDHVFLFSYEDEIVEIPPMTTNA